MAGNFDVLLQSKLMEIFENSLVEENREKCHQKKDGWKVKEKLSLSIHDKMDIQQRISHIM